MATIGKTGGSPYRARDGTQGYVTRASALVAKLSKEKGQCLVWSVDGQVYEADGDDIFATRVAEGVITRWPMLITGDAALAERALNTGEKFFLAHTALEGVVEGMSQATMFAWLEEESVE